MSNSLFVTFRGTHDVEIEYTDSGYEPDTGAHGLEWDFVDPKFQSLDLTLEETRQIMERIAQAAFDNQRDDDF